MGNTTLISGKQTLKRGDIYYADLTGIENSIGCEQTGKRPVLIIQNNIGNFHSPTTIVAILTTRHKANLPTHVKIKPFDCLDKNSTVCLEQIKTIDKIRLGEYLGNVGPEEMENVDKALSISLGVDNLECVDNFLYTNMPDMFSSSDSMSNNSSQAWIKHLEEQLSFFNSVKHRMYTLKCDIDKINTELSTILEHIEFTNFNAVQGYKFYKLIRERKKQRRELSTELQQLEILASNIDVQQISFALGNSLKDMATVANKSVSNNVIIDLLKSIE